MSTLIPFLFTDALDGAHPSWHACLQSGLIAMMESDPEYLAQLANDRFLPEGGRVFAAFSMPLDDVRHVLVGEGPYPRAESATGFCFMDGAVHALWSEKGLSKPVNRATSLRNFMKMLLVADGQLLVEKTGGESVAPIARRALDEEALLIRSREELQQNMIRQGFLLLNATLVYRPDVSPRKEARAWQPFLQAIFNTLKRYADQNSLPLPTLVLWGKVAERLAQLSVTEAFPHVVSEHPYNLSFIASSKMQDFFGPMKLLEKPVRG